MNPMDAFPDLDSISTPEEQDQLFGLSGQDEKRALLERQLAQAQALKNHRTAGSYTNPTAAGIAGIGDIINAIRGGSQEQQQLSALNGLSADKAKALHLYMQLGQRHAPDLSTDSLVGGDTGGGDGFNAFPGMPASGPDSRTMQPQGQNQLLAAQAQALRGGQQASPDDQQAQLLQALGLGG